MNVDLAIAIGAGILVMIGLLFLSGIHIFMIPKDVLDRETKPRDKKEDQPVEPPEEN